MAEKYLEKSLPTGTDGKTRPAVWDDEKEKWVVPNGRDGRWWTRDPDVESQLKKLNEATKSNKVDFPDDYPDKDVKSELESIKSTQAEILERLDGTFDTKLTGSNVEDKNAIPIKQVVSVTEEILVESEEIGPGSLIDKNVILDLPFYVIGVHSDDRDLKGVRAIISWRDSKGVSFTPFEKEGEEKDGFRFLTEKKSTRTKNAKIYIYNDGEAEAKFTVILYQMAN